MSAKISYLGIAGSYSYQACEALFPDGEYRGYKNFSEAIHSVQNGENDYAIIPIENSTAGRITEVYNLLPTIDLHIINEYLLPIHHCLVVPAPAFRGLVPSNIKEDDILAWKRSPLTEEERQKAFRQIREVQSHQQALMQCENYILKNMPQAATVPVSDTATAARELSSRTNCDIAAITSRYTTDLYKLLVLEDNIEDDPTNMTRFLVFARDPATPETLRDKACVTSIIFQTKHVPGSLLRALEAFAKAEINLTKLETYMLNQRLPKPTFYVDVGAGVSDPRLQDALKNFAEHCEMHKILGSYPASAQRGVSNGFLPVTGPFAEL